MSMQRVGSSNIIFRSDSDKVLNKHFIDCKFTTQHYQKNSRIKYTLTSKSENLIALRAMAKYNNVSELDFAKHFLSIKNEEDARYALMRNVEGLRSEMDDFDDDNEEEN